MVFNNECFVYVDCIFFNLLLLMLHLRILVCLFDARSDFKMVKYTCINIKSTVVLNGKVLHISDEFRACRNCYLHCFGKSVFRRLKKTTKCFVPLQKPRVRLCT